MIIETKDRDIQAKDISELLYSHFPSLLAAFYEMQSSFLSGIYKRYKNIETANIIMCLAASAHLEIIRQREKNLDHDVSLENFWNNLTTINKPSQKIASIVKTTGIPKETTRRKIKKLTDKEYVTISKNNKAYSWNLLLKHKDSYYGIINEEIKILAKFITKSSNFLKLNLDSEIVEKEIKSQFSFYWYHFLSCQLKWLKMWQDKLKDIDLILITLQTVIPTLQYMDKNQNIKNLGLNNIYEIIGKTNNQYKFSDTAVGAASVSEITGIPRATCIRKLDKLVKLGLLIQETKSRRYFVNQSTSSRTKNIFTKENILYTIKIFSENLSIIINALSRNR